MKRGDPPSPAAYCNDPAFIKKVDLIGRNEQLTNIRSHLSDVKAQGKQGWVCLWGPGGIGKTQLAATYALESRSLYSQMFKVSGTSPEFIQEEFARLVEKQSKKSPEDPNGHDSIPEWPPDDSPPEFRQRALQQRVEMAHNWFQAHKEWLLVIDDARLSHVDLPHYIPPTNHGDIIITTQTRHAVSRGLFEIPPLSVGDAVTLLLNKAGKRDQQSRDSARPRATEIVELLGCLPLAVEHAGALIGIKGIPYFWVTFHSSPITVLDQSDMMAAHRESVFRTFKMSFDVLKEQNRCAAKFLVFLAFLDNTTISTDAFFDEYGVPKPSLKHMGLFKTKLEFHEAMGALRSSALIKNNENEDDKEVLLHPLVHHMTRARLPTAYLTSWTGNAADYLCWPLVQPQPVSTEIQVSPFDFKSILQVMRQAAELDVPQPPTDTFLRLWHVLGYMLLRYVSCWHAYGKHEQLEQYAKRAIMVLEQHTDPQVQLVVGSLVVVVSAITSYTRSSETSESVAKSFLSKYLRPAAAMALQRAADRGIAPPECFEPVRFVWTYKPRTLRAAFKSNTPENVISGLGRYFSELAKLCAGRNHWHEALVLAQFAEVPASLWGKPPNRLPVSRLVTAAYYASSDRGMAEYLDILAGIKGDPNETDSLSAAHDSGRILLKQGEFAKAEAVLVSARDALLKSSDLSLPIMSNGYIWIIKTLSLAQVHLQRQADAQQQLLDTHAKVKGAGGDDTLGMLHIEMLLASFHRNHGIEIPLLAETYDKQVADRFERMYAATKEKVLGAEGLNTALVLLSQGAQEEAVVVLALFRDASSAMLGPDHELPQRAERFRRIAEKEMEKEAENERNGDCWLRFGSAMLPRDARALDSGGQPTTKSAVSWVTEENQGAWGVRDEFEAVLVDLGVFPLPSMQVLRSLLMGSRLLQVFLFSFVVLLVSIGLVAVLR
ncbi:hypothetical protein C8A05DRAFT_18515 [Staphylotrichum tortipilum]|uniref:NB-ARC domain-containing protein n=1 Tax=Staphylotrichum tortipilum TaxID=2831512 RepID=A0AAN6MF68_9PEZI|nr:hypothetical protein C8A05DRAFT_18515 [Staphylotrichum longicolle]